MVHIAAQRVSVIAWQDGVDPFVIVIRIASPAAKMGEVVFVMDLAIVPLVGKDHPIAVVKPQ